MGGFEASFLALGADVGALADLRCAREDGERLGCIAKGERLP